ncbi:unnamed protein product [Rodentolepis nana]|uniref:SH2 domain-containing protein n=1 Tax=Rodentolepis nana TaxID=102285 RepID=A0A0R3TC49_RODNA|nr:unnamed protein product [Rodentolepis nana]
MRKIRKSSDLNDITPKKNLSFTKWGGKSSDYNKKAKDTLVPKNSPSVIEKDTSYDGSQKTILLNNDSLNGAYPARVQISPIKPDGDSCQTNFEQPLTETPSKMDPTNESLRRSLDNKVSANRTNLNRRQQKPNEKSGFVDNFVAMMHDLEEMNMSYLKNDIVSKLLSNLAQNSNIKSSERVSTPLSDNPDLNTDGDLNNDTEGPNILSDSNATEEFSRSPGDFKSKIQSPLMKYSSRNDRRSLNERMLSGIRKEPTISNSEINRPLSRRAVSSDRKDVRSYLNRSDPPNDKASIYWYFWVPETQAFLINNPQDRRVEALVRSSRSKIYLHRDKRVNAHGEHQQLVAIYSPEKFYLQKCKNLIDEKFPIFKINCGSEKEPGSIAEFY